MVLRGRRRKKKKKFKMRVSLPSTPCKPYLTSKKISGRPQHASLSLVKFFWDLTIIHPTPEAEEDMRAAALCGPFRTVPDWKSQSRLGVRMSGCQDVVLF